MYMHACMGIIIIIINVWDQHVKPSNKNQNLGTLGDFEFVVDYASTISLDSVFKIS